MAGVGKHVPNGSDMFSLGMILLKMRAMQLASKNRDKSTLEKSSNIFHNF
jgi:hypothetical protein